MAVTSMRAKNGAEISPPHPPLDFNRLISVLSREEVIMPSSASARARLRGYQAVPGDDGFPAEACVPAAGYSAGRDSSSAAEAGSRSAPHDSVVEDAHNFAVLPGSRSALRDSAAADG